MKASCVMAEVIAGQQPMSSSQPFDWDRHCRKKGGPGEDPVAPCIGIFTAAVDLLTGSG